MRANDAAFRVFMARVLEHAMTTRRVPSFHDVALRLSKKLGLSMTCKILESKL